MNMKKKFLLESVKKGFKMFKIKINLVIFIGFFITINANYLYPTGVDAELIQHLSQTIKAGEMFALVEELSSGTYEGRLTGTEGYNKAAAFAANYFKKYGVIPLGKDYMQTFPLSYTKVYESTLKIFLEAPHAGRANTRKRMKTNTNELAQHIGSPRRGVEGTYFKNFYPLNFSGKGNVKEEIIFAGYEKNRVRYFISEQKWVNLSNRQGWNARMLKIVFWIENHFCYTTITAKKREDITTKAGKKIILDMIFFS